MGSDVMATCRSQEPGGGGDDCRERLPHGGRRQAPPAGRLGQHLLSGGEEGAGMHQYGERVLLLIWMLWQAALECDAGGCSGLKTIRKPGGQMRLLQG
jgi:hypothetical protein